MRDIFGEQSVKVTPTINFICSHDDHYNLLLASRNENPRKIIFFVYSCLSDVTAVAKFLRQNLNDGDAEPNRVICQVEESAINVWTTVASLM